MKIVSSSTILMLLKYTGSILAGAYGVYATVTDFKEEKNGKKVLSKKGRWGIALLLFSILLNLSSDAYKDTQERAKERAQDEKAAAEQRTLTDSLNRQQSMLNENLAKVQSLGSNLRETSDQLQRGILGHLTKVNSFSAGVSFYRKMDWNALMNAPSNDAVLNMFWCVQHMSTADFNLNITPQIDLHFQIDRQKDGSCKIKTTARWEDKSVGISNLGNWSVFRDAISFEPKVDVQSFAELNPHPIQPDATSFKPGDDDGSLIGSFQPDDPSSVESYRQLQHELEQSLPTEIHLRIYPNMIFSDYVTTWSLWDRAIGRSRTGPFVAVGFKCKKFENKKSELLPP